MTGGAASMDRELLARRIESLNTLIRSHAGGLELVDVRVDGTVVVRYTGMCTACEYRPMTTAGTVGPALLAIPGIERVEVRGGRVSEEAESRIKQSLMDSVASERAVRLVTHLEASRDSAPL